MYHKNYNNKPFLYIFRILPKTMKALSDFLYERPPYTKPGSPPIDFTKAVANDSRVFRLSRNNLQVIS